MYNCWISSNQHKMYEYPLLRGCCQRFCEACSNNRGSRRLSWLSSKIQAAAAEGDGWTCPRGVAKTQPTWGVNRIRGSNGGEPCECVPQGCRIDKQGLRTLGLAVKRRWPEIADLAGRCRDEGDAIQVVFSGCRHGNTAVGTTQKRI